MPIFRIVGALVVIGVLLSLLQGTAAFGGIMLALLLVVGTATYFAPAIVAFRRRHSNRVAIFVLTLLTGWTFIGWVAAIVWAFTDKVDPAPPPQTDDKSAYWDNVQAAGLGNLQPWGSPDGTRPVPTPDTKTCPHCAEEVKFAARRCKHCGAELAA